MTFDEAKAMYQRINATRLTALRSDFDAAAVCYARMRVNHLLAPAAKRQSMDTKRTELHNAFIGACDQLADAMCENAEDAAWRTELGQDRKVIGDLACFVHCILGLVAR